MPDKDKVDEAAVRRAMDAVAATWRQIRNAHSPQLLVGTTGTRLFEGLADLRRRLARMLNTIAQDTRSANKSSFDYTPHLGSIHPPERRGGGFVAINPGQAEQLRNALNQAAGTFGQYRSQLASLFTKAGGTNTAACTHGAHLCGAWAADLKLRLEYVRAADKIKFFQGAGQSGTTQMPEWQTYAELKDAVSKAQSAAAVAEFAHKKKQEGAKDGKSLLGKVTSAVSSYRKGAWDASAGIAKSYWEYSPFRIAVQPKDWWNNTVKPNWEMLKQAKQDPVKFATEFGKSAINWELWKKDPAQAAGHLGTDVAAAIAFRKIVRSKSPHTFREKTPEETNSDINAILDDLNPAYNPTKSAYRENCTRVVDAYELRRRGIQVQPAPVDKHLRLDEGGPGGPGLDVIERRWGRNFTRATQTEIEEAFRQPGSRGIVAIRWKPPLRGAHVFNVENVGGKVRFIDGQPNPPVKDASQYFEKGQDLAFLRLDDLPTPGTKPPKRPKVG